MNNGSGGYSWIPKSDATAENKRSGREKRGELWRATPSTRVQCIKHACAFRGRDSALETRFTTLANCSEASHRGLPLHAVVQTRFNANVCEPTLVLLLFSLDVSVIIALRAVSTVHCRSPVQIISVQIASESESSRWIRLICGIARQGIKMYNLWMQEQKIIELGL